MEYQEFLETVQQLDFIENEQTADAAIKAVLGILASRMSEVQAQEFLDELPEPLTLEHLRGRQQPAQSSIPADEYFQEIQEQFKLDEQQATTLVGEVLRVAKQAIPEGKQYQVIKALPSEWEAVVRGA